MVKINHLVALLFALSVAIPLASATSKGFTYCNKNANYPVKVSGLDISPYPISRGKNTSFAISASTDKPISGGKLIIDVKYWIIHADTEEKDLCKETQCPVPVGKFVVSHSQELPGYTPPGSYTLKMTMEDEKKKQLTCITFDFSIGFITEEENLASS